MRGRRRERELTFATSSSLKQAKRASGQTESLIPLHLLLAHLRLAKARGAPKVILENARTYPFLLSLERGRRTRSLTSLISTSVLLPFLAEFDKLPPTTLPKSVYYEQAAEQINKAQAVQSQTGAAIDIVGYLSRGAFLVSFPSFLAVELEAHHLLSLGSHFGSAAVHYLSTGNSDQALKFFEAVLTREPNNLVALMGKVRSKASSSFLLSPSLPLALLLLLLSLCSSFSN